MEFNVNAELIGSSQIIDQSLSLGIPQEWLAIDSLAFAEISRAINDDTLSFLRLDLKRVYKSAEGASCLVSRVTNIKELSRLSEPIFEDILGRTFQAEDIAMDAFTVNGTRAIQYRIIGTQIICFKLFPQVSESIYQIDYFIPKSVYETEARKIESSIGSICSVH